MPEEQYTNDFQVFGENSNMLDLSAYVADTNNVRTEGNVPNTQTSSALNNRVLEQVSKIAAALGELCVINNISLKDTTVADVAASLSSLFATYSTESSVTASHNDLPGRDAAFCHPISAIGTTGTTSLSTQLDSKFDKSSLINANATYSSTNAYHSQAIHTLLTNLAKSCAWSDLSGSVTDNTQMSTALSNLQSAYSDVVTASSQGITIGFYADEASAISASASNPNRLCFYPEA